MPLIQNLESKINLAKTIAIVSFVTSIIIVVVVAIFFNAQMAEARKTIYILDKDVPILAKQTDQQVNRPVEYRAHVDLYHWIYFTLTPDDKHIQHQMQKAMYMVDESGMQQYNNLKEKGYFSQILASSAVLTIQTDSIVLDVPNKYFRYYGKQRIDRKSSTVTRNLITEGYLQDIERSANNPHGIIIQRWKTLENKDLDYVTKQSL